jgi:hypothetical protein
MYINQTGYTWYILGYTMYIHQEYTWYIHGYTWYIIGCIYVVYTWYIGISIDIPSFLKPDFAAGPCCWPHSMRTRVRVIKSVLFHTPPWQLRQGKGGSQKAQPDCHQRSPSVAGGGGDGSGGGDVAGVFPFS